MTSADYLSMQITKFYLDSLHEAHDSPNSITYRTLMDVNAVVVAEREKADPNAWMPAGQCASCRRNFTPPTNQRGYCAECMIQL